MGKRKHFAEDYIGKKFGMLTVLAGAGRSEKSELLLLCRCDCGVEKLITCGNLVSGGTVSCGCKNRFNEAKHLGKRIGKLTVIPGATKRNNGEHFFNCKCDCGNELLVSGAFLFRNDGNAKQSCGCHKLEKVNPDASCIRLYKTYQNGAAARDLSFDLDFKEFKTLTSSNCFYCGAAPTRVLKSSNLAAEYKYNGIDRLHSSKGYTLSNVVPCCTTCNYAKGTTGAEDFIAWANKVSSHSGEKVVFIDWVNEVLFATAMEVNK